MHTTAIFFDNKYLTTRENNFLWPQSAKENTGENLTMYKNNQNPNFRGLFKHYLTFVYRRSKLNLKLSFRTQSFEIKNKKVIKTV